jgi:hypothetical protein
MSDNVQELIDKAVAEQRLKDAILNGKSNDAENEPEIQVVNPDTLSDSNVDKNDWFPKRNKKRNKKPDKTQTADLNGLLWMVHKGIASLTGIEQFELEPEESKELAEAIARVQMFYPNSVLSPLAMAWTGLIFVSSKIYGTRMIAYANSKKKKPQVVTIPTPPGTEINTAVNENM